MTLRYLAVVLTLTAVGAGLLGMRQQQLIDKHAIAESHTKMKSDREQIKDLQVRIAKLAEPEKLKDALDRSRLKLEPMARKAPGPDDKPELVKDANQERGPAAPRDDTTPEPRDG